MPKAVNRVDYGGQTLIDISDSTVTAAGLRSGLKAYGADGQVIIGALMEKFAGYAEAVKVSGGSGFTATIADLTEITAGTVIAVRFPESISTSTDAILNVNSLGDMHLAYLGYRLGNVALSLGTQRIMNSHSQGYIPKDSIIFLVAANAVTATGGTGSLHWNIVNPQETCLFGKCTTAAATATKEVLIPGVFELYEGLTIKVYFAYANSASNPTLMVNGLPAARIIRNATYASNNASGSWQGMAIVTLTYFINGGTPYWSLNDWNNSTYSNASLGHAYGTCAAVDSSTGECTVTAANYQLGAGAIVSVAFSIDVPAASTLNVNARGAKAIYYRGAAIKANIIHSGDTGVFIYDGTHYVLLAIDRKLSQTYYGTINPEDFSYFSSPNEVTVACDDFSRAPGDILIVDFNIDDAEDPSDYPLICLNSLAVNGTPATQIYHRGHPVCTVTVYDPSYTEYNNQTSIQPGDVATFRYDGTHYVLIGIDRDSKPTVVWQQGTSVDSSTGAVDMRLSPNLSRGSGGKIQIGDSIFMQSFSAYSGSINLYFMDGTNKYWLKKVNPTTGQTERAQSLDAGLYQVIITGSNEAYMAKLS